jgi:hypothetical protein
VVDAGLVTHPGEARRVEQLSNLIGVIPDYRSPRGTTAASTSAPTSGLGSPARPRGLGAGSGGNAAAINTASVYVNLKPLGVRKASANEIIARLRPRLAQLPGGEIFLTAIQDFRVGARQSNAGRLPGEK